MKKDYSNDSLSELKDRVSFLKIKDHTFSTVKSKISVDQSAISMNKKLEELKLLSNSNLVSTINNTNASNTLSFCNKCASKLTIPSIMEDKKLIENLENLLSKTKQGEFNKGINIIIKFIFLYLYYLEIELTNVNSIFEIKLQSNNFQYNKETEGEPQKYIFLIVDDEAMIRSAMKRVITNEFKSLSHNIDLTIIEANDGMECILAIYLARQMNLAIDGIISDETMPFISGSYCSKIILELISNGVIKDINMFISTSLTDSNLIENYSKVVKKIFPKPINKSNVRDLINNYCK